MWTNNYERQNEIESKISKAIKEFVNVELNTNPEEKEMIISEMKNALDYRPPQIKEQPIQMVFNSGGDLFGSGSASYRPGNVALNLRKLLRVITDSAQAAGGGLSFPWLVPVAAVQIIYNVVGLVKVELSNVEGAILITAELYEKNGFRGISGDKLFQQVNLQLAYHKLSPITRKEFNLAINKLLELRIFSETSKGFVIREFIVNNYN
ncbi:hypothetical protein [Bacillus sp. EB01]|uniref:hypothetical protein n=1 Tax=Bacillus sp. EB01 TaxID=1347086 RepID=UPI0005C7A3FF|nr:hypothetical protein [Bacillus sp. EB01]